MTFTVSHVFMVGLDKQPLNTDPSQTSGLAPRFQESMNVHRGAGVSTAVTLQTFLYFTMVHLQLNISSNEVEKPEVPQSPDARLS